MTALYKLTAADGSPVHGGSGKWNLPNGKPGRWRSVKGELVACQNGLHLLRPEDIRQWLRVGVLWHVEAGTEQLIDADKVVVRKARLTGKAADITDSVLRELAADFAEHVLHLYEKRHPKDMRPREAIAAARAFARGAIGMDELRRKRADGAAIFADAYAADAAAYAAAYAADAAAAAAAAAADAAADAASAYADAASAAYAYAYADAATADAYDAAYARSKEHAWQTARVIEVLGLR